MVQCNIFCLVDAWPLVNCRTFRSVFRELGPLGMVRCHNSCHLAPSLGYRRGRVVALQAGSLSEHSIDRWPIKFESRTSTKTSAEQPTSGKDGEYFLVYCSLRSKVLWRSQRNGAVEWGRFWAIGTRVNRYKMLLDHLISDTKLRFPSSVKSCFSQGGWRMKYYITYVISRSEGMLIQT